ncbi:amino acid ABC transporter substrate-binding protein [Pseudogemmobacter humi]|uniref:General L-amino acid-binding periplasmic protein AapJ n=1 Tax=Pseudogemmobacter humi TaxID=2483812 RepID=A0A3P5X7X3_9RHOB|nr:amino acid ABC transporter substrate-binding protein [Pseudogemmobacter humi]VDC26366.1 General L-amino acid-binding periplasmic protein AapJ precursor [Pseudogemmobacter humi]
MRKPTFPACLAAAVLAAAPALAATLDEVRARGELICGVNAGLTGFAVEDANENWVGFDADLCRAVAAAVLGDPARARFQAISGQDRFAALASGAVDLIVRDSAAVFSADAGSAVDFPAITYYDGQGFMVKKEMAVASAKELFNAEICIRPGSPAQANLDAFFKANNLTYQPVEVKDDAEAQRKYLEGDCAVLSTDVASLAAVRAGTMGSENHVLLPEIISKEPFGPAVRHGDDQWGDIIRWTVNALLIAEEKGITRANIEEVAASSADPEVRRLLGLEGGMGAMFGLDNDWARRALAASGNYGEIFEANIGSSTPIGLARGLNALWTQGGLQYAWPMR